MMDKLLKVLLMSVVMFGLAGCYNRSSRQEALPPAASVKNTIAILPYGEQNAFWQEFRKGAEEAVTAAGMRLQWEAPPPVWNPKTQEEMMDNIQQLNPPGIVLAPLHRNLLQAPLVDTVKQAIPVVVAASNEDTAYKVTYVGSDNIALGKDLATWIAKLTPPKSKIAIVNIQAGMRSFDLRKHEVLQALSQSDLLISQTPFSEGKGLNYEESNLQDKMRDSLQQHLKDEPEIKAVVALDENSTKAAWQVLTAIPEKNRPLLFGVSVDPDLIKLSQEGKIAALAVQDAHAIGAESVKVIVGFKNGKRPKQEIFIPYKIISAGD